MASPWPSLLALLVGSIMMATAGPFARARVRWEQRLLGRPYNSEEITRRCHFVGGLLSALGELLLYLAPS